MSPPVEFVPAKIQFAEEISKIASIWYDTEPEKRIEISSLAECAIIKKMVELDSVQTIWGKNRASMTVKWMHWLNSAGLFNEDDDPEPSTAVNEAIMKRVKSTLECRSHG